MNKAYQCSKCERLIDLGEKCECSIGIDPRPNYREKGNAKTCKWNFKLLEKEKQWHEKFNWE